ncbi:hypothetical protein NPIL_320391, partial [Nephila pilipes]
SAADARNVVTRYLVTLACSLASSLSVPALLSYLRRSILARQPLEMELLLTSPDRSKLDSMIRFCVHENTAADYLHSQMCEVYGEKRTTRAEMVQIIQKRTYRCP